MIRLRNHGFDEEGLDTRHPAERFDLGCQGLSFSGTLGAARRPEQNETPVDRLEFGPGKIIRLTTPPENGY